MKKIEKQNKICNLLTMTYFSRLGRLSVFFLYCYRKTCKEIILRIETTYTHTHTHTHKVHLELVTDGNKRVAWRILVYINKNCYLTLIVFVSSHSVVYLQFDCSFECSIFCICLCWSHVSSRLWLVRLLFQIEHIWFERRQDLCNMKQNVMNILCASQIHRNISKQTIKARQFFRSLLKHKGVAKSQNLIKPIVAISMGHGNRLTRSSLCMFISFKHIDSLSESKISAGNRIE